MAITTKNQPSTVAVGTKILIELNGELQSLEIVNPGESDIQEGKVSCSAPLIQCILGAKEGDIINCKIMDRDFSVAIKNIQRFTKLTGYCMLNPLLL